MKLEIVDKSAKTVTQAFGINPRRDQELNLLAEKAFLRWVIEQSPKAEAISEMAEEAKNPAELVMLTAGFLITGGAFNETLNRNMDPSPEEQAKRLLRVAGDKIEKLKNT